MTSNGEPVTRREHEAAWEHHERLHQDHIGAHAREHEMTNTAISKAEQAVARALDAAMAANDKRFDAVNEFRATLADAAARFATQATVIALEKALVDKINERAESNRARIDRLEKDASNMAGRLWALGVGLGLLIVVLQFVVPMLRTGG